MSHAPLEPRSPGPHTTLDEDAPLPRRVLSMQRLEPGTCLGARYTLEEPLGQGGMGTVYAAHDRVADLPVALKFIHPGLAVDTRARRRLRRELKTALAVSHPNVARTHTLEELDGHTFLVMERLDGPTLAARLERGRPSPAEGLRIARSILAGVAAAHERGVVHRDLKPLNIKVCEDGRVVVMDFGLAVLHEQRVEAGGRLDSITPHASHWGGTPGYMAPEVVKGKVGNARADVFALGVVLFEIFVGQPPMAIGDTLFRDSDPGTAPLWPGVALGDLPRWQTSLLRDALEHDPARRPADAGVLLRRLEQHARPRTVRRRWLVIAAAAVALAGLAGSGLFARGSTESTRRDAPVSPAATTTLAPAPVAAPAPEPVPVATSASEPTPAPVPPPAAPVSSPPRPRRVRAAAADAARPASEARNDVPSPSAPVPAAAPATEATPAPAPATAPVEDDNASRRRKRLHLDD